MQNCTSNMHNKGKKVKNQRIKMVSKIGPINEGIKNWIGK